MRLHFIVSLVLKSGASYLTERLRSEEVYFTVLMHTHSSRVKNNNWQLALHDNAINCETPCINQD
jgi:hypothetical protein